MKIKECRRAAGISQGALAKKVGITPQYLCGLENGKKENPTYQLLLKIAEALNVTVNDLLDQRAG